jgi:glutaminase
MCLCLHGFACWALGYFSICSVYASSFKYLQLVVVPSKHGVGGVLVGLGVIPVHIAGSYM